LNSQAAEIGASARTLFLGMALLASLLAPKLQRLKKPATAINLIYPGAIHKSNRMV
jgi:hypothetical protein